MEFKCCSSMVSGEGDSPYHHEIHGQVIVHADIDCFYCQVRWYAGLIQNMVFMVSTPGNHGCLTEPSTLKALYRLVETIKGIKNTYSQEHNPGNP